MRDMQETKTLLNNDRLNKLVSICIAKDIQIEKVDFDCESNIFCLYIKSPFVFPEVFECSDGVIIDYKDDDIIKAYIENT
jgi:hypothetical protein